MKKLYMSPALTMELLQTEDVMSLSTNLVANGSNEIVLNYNDIMNGEWSE